MASKEITTPVNAKVDFEVNAKIKMQLALKKKIDEKPIDRERHLGIMIEERFQLDEALKNKQMTFPELIKFLRKV
jgi:hypothetical protein